MSTVIEMADSLTKVLVVRLEAFSYKFCFFVLVVFSHCSLPARTGSRPAENYAGKPFYLYFTTIANPPVSPSHDQLFLSRLAIQNTTAEAEASAVAVVRCEPRLRTGASP
jgi:hypothetical protein